MRQQYDFVNWHPLARRARLRAWVNILRWQIRSRLQPGIIRRAWIEGSVLLVERGMTGATGNLYVGLHEFEDMGFLLHFLRPSDLFVDVGANIGSFTILASRVCGARSIAFEPDPGTAGQLADNVRANAISDLVEVRQSAVGSAIGTVSFSKSKDTVNHVVGAAENQENVRRVAVTTLDATLAGDHPVLIKIDVEGYEADVIAGAERVLADRTLQAIIIESLDADIRATLLRHGFRESSYDPFERALTEGKQARSGPNSLFLRDEGFISERVIGARRYSILGQSL